METITTRNGDGTYDIVQRGSVSESPGPGELEGLYWEEVRASTLGLVSYSRNAIRIAGVWPRLIAFDRADGQRRKIVGGLFARRPYGYVAWAVRDGEVSVAVERFRPRLPRPLFRIELWVHERVGKRFLTRVNRRAG